MTKEEIYAIWAPETSLWSRWVKPVLFAHLDSALAEIPLTETACDVSWAPPAGLKTVLVVDLPSANGVLAGLALAEKGYRPVPLYNAVPLPCGQPILGPSTGRPVAAVNVWPILSSLRAGAERLAQLELPADAPPAFLLDANRAGEGRTMDPGEFDNRSTSFTTDFPSANFFASHGFNRMLLVQNDRLEPRPDLAHSLRRWQDAGFILERKRADSPAPPDHFEVPRPSWYGAMFQRALASIGLRRAANGGFGSWVPDSSGAG